MEMLFVGAKFKNMLRIKVNSLISGIMKCFNDEGCNTSNGFFSCIVRSCDETKTKPNPVISSVTNELEPLWI